jgi:DNA polymerase
VALGATAARAVVGRTVAITRERVQLLESDLAPVLVATFHPSAVLRAQDRKDECTQHSPTTCALSRST